MFRLLGSNDCMFTPTIVFFRYTVLRTSLEITNLEINDSGKYQCFAENDAGSIWGNVTLKVIQNEG